MRRTTVKRATKKVKDCHSEVKAMAALATISSTQPPPNIVKVRNTPARAELDDIYFLCKYIHCTSFSSKICRYRCFRCRKKSALHAVLTHRKCKQTIPPPSAGSLTLPVFLETDFLKRDKVFAEFLFVSRRQTKSWYCDKIPVSWVVIVACTSSNNIFEVHYCRIFGPIFLPSSARI